MSTAPEPFVWGYGSAFYEDPGEDITEPDEPLSPETVEKLREQHGIELPEWKPKVGNQ